jgi:lysophospholipase L1-like esterase
MKKIFPLLCLSLFLWSGTAPKRKILIIGDSISIGYFPFVQTALADQADVVHNKGNAQHTGTGLKNINQWLGEEKWDVIQFNWGLWDLCYRPVEKGPENRDKINGKLTTTLEQYKKNLEELVSILKKTNARLLFVTTTYVPENEKGRFSEDALKYNDIAKEVMRRNGIPVNDIFELSKKLHKKHGLAPDDVHYTKEGYGELAKCITACLKKIK